MLTYYTALCPASLRHPGGTHPCDSRLVVLPSTKGVKGKRVACPNCGRVYSFNGPARQFEFLQDAYRYSPERVQRLAVDTLRSRYEAYSESR